MTSSNSSVWAVEMPSRWGWEPRRNPMIKLNISGKEGNLINLIAKVRSLGEELGKDNRVILFIQGKMSRSCSYDEALEHFKSLFHGEVELITEEKQ